MEILFILSYGGVGGGARSSILIQVLSFDYDMKLDTVNDSSETAFF